MGLAVLSNRTGQMFFLALATSLAGSALAAPLAPTTVPQTVEPGLLQERLRSPFARPQLDGSDVVTGRPQESGSTATDNGVSFVLNDIVVQDATAIPAAELKPIYASRLGQPVTLNGLRAIADEITAHYRNKGYILSRAVVPAGQQIQNGVVTLRIVEGFVDEVVFEGAEGQDMALLESYGQRITRERPLSNAALERYLLLMDDLTGATARGVLSPSPTTQGASRLTVNIQRKPVDANLTVDNRGSRFLGPIQTSALVATNSALGLSERIQIRGITASNFDELGFVEGTYQQPVGPEGTTLRGTASYAETRPGNGLKPLDIEGESAFFTVAARHPFLRSRKENLFGEAGLRYRDSKTDVLSTELYDDHIRSAYIGGAYDVLDGLQGINRVDLEAVQGLSVLGSNNSGDLLSRSNADSTFTRVTGQYTRLQPLSQAISAFWGVSGQYAFDPLFASEEFALGGPAYGSAYDPAELTGDSGVATRVEMRYSDSLPEWYLDIYQLYGFYDIGRVWNRDALVGENARASLASTGVGVRFTLTDNLAGSAEVAVPLTRDVAAEGTDGNDVRGFFSISYIY
jgi:hemolysin activation/secretion protein